MTIEETKKAIEVMQAFVDGKDIEWFNEDHWEVIKDPCWEWDEDNPQYRIKPEPHYRPFKSAEEVMEAIKEHGVNGEWLRRMQNGRFIQICEFDDEIIWLHNSKLGCFYKDIYELFTFADGTPFGVKEE